MLFKDGRVKRSLICALALSLVGFSNAVEVNDFSSFQSAYQDANTTEIILNSGLAATGDILTPSSNDLTIIGNSNSLTGDGFKGFYVEDGQVLTLKDFSLISGFENTYYKETVRNTATDYHCYGGAIYGTIGNLENVSFTNNSATATSENGYAYTYGGAIYNNYGGTIGSLTNVTFTNNSLTATGENGGALARGGAISNIGTIGNLENVSFTNNSVTATSENGTAGAEGGAIYNLSRSAGNLTNVSFANNSATSTSENGKAYANGGAIYSEHAIGNLANVSFTNNSAVAINKNKDTRAGGGAIYNVGAIGDLTNVLFVNNSTTARSKNGKADAQGGTIYNWSVLNKLTDVSFTNNSATAKSENGGAQALGGAIYNNDTIGYLDNTTFINNSVTATGAEGFGVLAQGGAIYNRGSQMNIMSKSGDTIFIGNSANGVSNAIYSTSDVNFNAGDYSIKVYDGVIAENSTININKSDIDISSAKDGSEFAPTHGKVVFANEIDGNTVNLYDGELVLSHHKYTSSESPILAGQLGVANFTDNSAFNIYGGNLSTMDNAAHNHHLGNFSLNTDIKMSVDADLGREKMDTISVSTFNNPNSSTIDVNRINIVSPTKKETLELNFISPEIQDTQVFQDLAQSVKYSGSDVAYSPIYQYKVGYNGSSGKFNFNKIALNPAILSTSTAAQSGAIATQSATFNEAFYNMDTYMMYDIDERIMMRDKNKYVSNYSQGMFYDNAITRRDNREAWLRPYVTFENVPLKNGPEVDNIAYGTYFGTNSRIKPLRYGWDGALGVFMGYNGSKQSYLNTDVTQNGGTLGFVGEAYKKNFFTGLSLNIGASHGIAHTMYGKENFTLMNYGVASKSGYNFEFKNGKYILQPSMLLGYSIIDTFDFINAAGVKITSKPIHNIHIEPGLRFIANLNGGWRPYLGVSMIWNALDKAKFMANDVALPETSIKPYVKYGVGLQKSWSANLSSFIQTYLTHGGRNGVGLQAGVSWLY